jgi:pimeloyl-ACP methyl ester carboxylesterase
MKLVIAIIGMLVLIGCNAQNVKNTSRPNKNKVEAYSPTIFPQDTTKLWVADGNIENDIVTIFCQGGPKDVLSFAEKGKTSWRYLPNYNDYYRIYLHQANTYNPDIFRFDGEFTMKMAKREVDNSSEILYRAIKYYKNKGKIVWVFGHSYGAFIIPHYLATRPSIADKYVLISGRIDDPKHVVEAHAKGFNGTYKEGIVFSSEENRNFSDYDEKDIRYYKRKQLLKAAIGNILYSKALKDLDLLNSIYIYNPKDERVGGLNRHELDFLRVKGFQIYKTQHEHGSTIYGLVDALKEGKVKL